MKRWGFLAALAAILMGCGRSDQTGGPSAGRPTIEPAPYTVASILDAPPPAGAKLVINAYAGLADNRLSAGCPGKSGSQLLTDRLIPQIQPSFGGFASRPFFGNDYPDDRAWLIASYDGDLPAYARLEGHMGDGRYRDCPDFERIFVVDAVLVDHQASSWRMDGGRSRIPQIPLPDGFADWPELEDAPAFSINYPPGSRVEVVDSVLPFERRIHFNDEAGTVVELRVREGEAPYDPYDPMVGGDIFQGYPQRFSQNGLMFMRDSEDALFGYATQREIRPGVGRTSAFFVGGGRTYEFSAEFHQGYDFSWEGVLFFHALVYSYAGPGQRQGDPTPTSSIKTEVVGSDFLSQEQLMEFARRDFGAGISLIEAEIVSEQRARAIQQAGCMSIQGHPDGVWLATLAGAVPDLPVLVIVAYDAATGAQYCAYVPPGQITPTPEPPTRTPTPPPPTVNPYPKPQRPLPSSYPQPARRGAYPTPTR